MLKVEAHFCFPNFCFLLDRKSTRLNSSHLGISYAVFCLKKQSYGSASGLLVYYVFDGMICGGEDVMAVPLERRRHILFFNDPATTEISTLSLHDALPISEHLRPCLELCMDLKTYSRFVDLFHGNTDRKSTRLNSSHLGISYAVFCLK